MNSFSAQFLVFFAYFSFVWYNKHKFVQMYSKRYKNMKQRKFGFDKTECRGVADRAASERIL